MATILPDPLFYTTLDRLLLEDENLILQRLYDRDAALLSDLTTIQGTREDLLDEFARVDDLEKRWGALNKVRDNILASFYQDISGAGVTDFDDNVEFFVNLIQQLKQNLGKVEELTSQIIRYAELRQELDPVVQRIVQLEDLDKIIKTKVDYIYGKWDVNPSDDILSL